MRAASRSRKSFWMSGCWCDVTRSCSWPISAERSANILGNVSYIVGEGGGRKGACRVVLQSLLLCR